MFWNRLCQENKDILFSDLVTTTQYYTRQSILYLYSLWNDHKTCSTVLKTITVVLDYADSWVLGWVFTLDNWKSAQLKIWIIQNKIKLNMYHTINITQELKHILKSLCVANPLTPKISLVILLTVCHAILMMSIWRIWYWIDS